MIKVLVIDDEKPTLSMFRLLLKALGYEVHLASSADEGIDMFREHRPKVVLTDIKMPGLDGFGVLDEVKKIDENAAVIMITGHGDTDLEQKAVDMKAVSFLHKPIDRDVLEKAMERALGGHG